MRKQATVKNAKPIVRIRESRTFRVDVEPVEVPIGADRQEVRSADGLRGVYVTVEDSIGAVVPGGQCACQVEIRNIGATVERFDVVVEGFPEHWTSLEPATVNLKTGASERVTVRFHPPVDSAAAAGAHRLAIRVWCPNDPTVRVDHPYTLTVGAHQDLRLRVEPEATTGRSGASVSVTVQNAGNHTVSGTLMGEDPGGGLRVQATPPEITVPPGASSTVQVEVRPRRRHWTGRSLEHTFGVSVVVPTGAPVGGTSARHTQVPVFPRWATQVAMVALPLLVVFAGFQVMSWLNNRPIPVDDVVGAPQQEAENRLRDQGFTVQVDQTSHETVSEGEVISQAPVAATPVSPGEAIRLTVSTGPPVASVPNVVETDVAQARQQLEDLGYEVLVTQEDGGGQIPGTVLSQEPGAGDELAVGGTVRLSVARDTGPVVVPDVVRLPESEARAQLSEAGVTVRTELGAADVTLAGRVIRVDPAPGTEVQPGAAVVIVVGTAPTPVEAPEPGTPGN